MTTKMKKEPNKVPTKLLKKHACSQIILGCNPFIGWSYRGKAVAQQYKEKFSHPEPIKEVIVHACSYGINAIMTTADACVLEAIRLAQEEVGDLHVMGMLGYSTEGYRNFKEDIQKFRNIEAPIAVIVAEITDPLIQKTPMLFDAYCAEVSKEFDTVGAATHNPGLSFPYLEKTEVDFLVAAVNPKGFMMGKKEVSYPLIMSCQKPLVAKKILAAGTVDPDTGFRFAFCETGVDFAVVGVASKEEVNQDVETYCNVSTNCM